MYNYSMTISTERKAGNLTLPVMLSKIRNSLKEIVMGKLIDLTGQRFGSWEVISRAPNKTTSPRKPRWYVLCDCGNTSVVYGFTLKGGTIV